jgi:hypothetical protein
LNIKFPKSYSSYMLDDLREIFDAGRNEELWELSSLGQFLWSFDLLNSIFN